MAAPVWFFFYGTLQRGHWNHRLAEGAERIEPASMPGLLFHLPRGYPACCVPEGASALVQGEAMAYPASEASQRLATLDELEDFDPAEPESSEYRRVLRPVTLRGSGALIEAWVYVYPEDRLPALEAGATHVVGGDWASFYAARRR